MTPTLSNLDNSIVTAFAPNSENNESKTDIAHALPTLWCQPRRADANRCLPVVLPMHWLWRIAAAKDGRLLRFLFIRHPTLRPKTAVFWFSLLLMAPDQ
ncbi:MAG: hypothetical protein KDI49_12980 [Gammaproteobacteria bacterium]|nr:hypothetical protein [Gammaproteobacteria bacterium]